MLIIVIHLRGSTNRWPYYANGLPVREFNRHRTRSLRFRHGNKFRLPCSSIIVAADAIWDKHAETSGERKYSLCYQVMLKISTSPLWTASLYECVIVQARKASLVCEWQHKLDYLHKYANSSIINAARESIFAAFHRSMAFKSFNGTIAGQIIDAGHIKRLCNLRKLNRNWKLLNSKACNWDMLKNCFLH